MDRMSGIIAGLLAGMGEAVPGEPDIERGGAAFGRVRRPRRSGLAEAGSEDIETGSSAFGGTGLGQDEQSSVMELAPTVDFEADAFFTWKEGEWDFDLTIPASRPPTAELTAKVAVAATKQAVTEIAETGSARQMNERLARQGVVPPPPGEAPRTAGEAAYQAVTIGLAKRGIIKAQNGKATEIFARPQVRAWMQRRPQSMEMSTPVPRGEMMAREAARQGKRPFSVVPSWLRGGRTSAG